MSKLKIISLISFTIIFLLGTTCMAKTYDLKQVENKETVSVESVSNYKSTIQQEIMVDGINYKLINTKQVENRKPLTIQKETQEELIVTTNNADEVLNQFEQEKNVTENGYEGKLNIQKDSLDIKVNESYKEEYKVYLQKTYENVSSNELNNIPKEIKKGGITYYLVNPVWNVISTEDVEENNVPLTYTGVMHYEGVSVRTVVKNYVATVKYAGTLSKDITESITFITTYQEIPKEENNNSVPILITTSGIVIFSGIVIIKRKNVKIYNFGNGKYRLVKRIHIDSKNPIIDITPARVTSNKYKIIISDNLYNEIKNCSVKFRYFDKQVNYIITEKVFEINV